MARKRERERKKGLEGSDLDLIPYTTPRKKKTKTGWLKDTGSIRKNYRQKEKRSQVPVMFGIRFRNWNSAARIPGRVHSNLHHWMVRNNVRLSKDTT